jgi:hypothetical protein
MLCITFVAAAAAAACQGLGMDWEERVLPSIGNEVVKSVVAQYNAEQLLTQREKVRYEARQTPVTAKAVVVARYKQHALSVAPVAAIPSLWRSPGISHYTTVAYLWCVLYASTTLLLCLYW